MAQYAINTSLWSPRGCGPGGARGAGAISGPPISCSRPPLLLLLTVLAYPLAWEVWTSFTSLSPLQEGRRRSSDSRTTAGSSADRSSGGRRPSPSSTRWSRASAKLGAGARLRPSARPAVPGPGPRLPGDLPALGVSGERERDRLVLDVEPPDHHRLRAASWAASKYAVDGAFGGGAWAFLSVTLFNIWRGSSFIGVLLLAGINAIPPELFEYALLESKSAWRRFRLVTVPLLKPFLALGGVPVAHERRSPTSPTSGCSPRAASSSPSSARTPTGSPSRAASSAPPRRCR